jgi:hypothetical protein
MKVIRTEFDIYVVIYIYHTTIVKSNTTGSSSEAGRVHSRCPLVDIDGIVYHYYFIYL